MVGLSWVGLSFVDVVDKKLNENAPPTEVGNTCSCTVQILLTELDKNKFKESHGYCVVFFFCSRLERSG